MLALLNRVWVPLKARNRQPPALAEKAFWARAGYVDELRELVASAPGISLEVSGILGDRCKVMGSPEAMADFLPRLSAWQHDCESRDAW